MTVADQLKQAAVFAAMIAVFGVLAWGCAMDADATKASRAKAAARVAGPGATSAEASESGSRNIVTYIDENGQSCAVEFSFVYGKGHESWRAVPGTRVCD